MIKLRVGSRESRLAVVQAELVIAAILEKHPDAEVTLLTMKTTGDRILDRTLDQVGGKGLFVKELDTALLEGQVDITVHSLKDMPMDTDPRIPIVALSRREDPRDALVLPAGVFELDKGKPVGCAGLRRKLQLERLFPGVHVAPVRGNVITRIAKLDGGAYAALVLAAAGLKRLGLEGRISRYFTPEEILPAAGQGILAVQARAGEDSTYLEGVCDVVAAQCATAERAFVWRLDGGCSSPVAAFATERDGILFLKGFDGAGNRDAISGPAASARALGIALADRMRGAC